MEKEKRHLELELPGFRFHPTEEELLGFYLKNMVVGTNMRLDIIGYLNIYLYDPWVLPGLSKIGEREWYFFVPRDRKHGRPNRTTQNGFWKATGSDRKIFGLSEPKRQLGLKKTLVFYKGRAPRGSKTDWVMNEYRLPDSCPFPKEVVLCKIYRKATSMKVLEQRAAMEMEMELEQDKHNSPPSDYLMLHDNESHQDLLLMAEEEMKEEPSDNFVGEEMKEEPSDNFMKEEIRHGSLKLPTGDGVLPDLQLPKTNTDWTQDSFWTQLTSPWLDNLILSSPYANILNF